MLITETWGLKTRQWVAKIRMQRTIGIEGKNCWGGGAQFLCRTKNYCEWTFARKLLENEFLYSSVGPQQGLKGGEAGPSIPKSTTPSATEIMDSNLRFVAVIRCLRPA